eukprot:376152-Rhodomonas_salina.1
MAEVESPMCSAVTRLPGPRLATFDSDDATLDEGAVDISLEQPLLDLHELDIPSVAEWDADWRSKQAREDSLIATLDDKWRAAQQREYEELNN